MDDGGADLSARARKRAAARERRRRGRGSAATILDLVVSGYTYEAIAEQPEAQRQERAARDRQGDRDSAGSTAARTTFTCRCCG